MILDNYALIHMFVAWNNFRGRTPPLNKTDCHVHENTHANEAVFYTSCTVHTTK